MKKNILVVLLIVSANALFLFYECAKYNAAVKAIRPPSGEVLLADFLNSERQICCVQEITIGEKNYTVVIGKLPKTSLLVLPSGPPAYIFDERCILIEWCRDTGDNPHFMEKWGWFKHAPDCSLIEKNKTNI